MRGRVRAGRSKPGAEGQQRGRSPDELVGLRLLPAADDVPPQTTAAVKPEPIGPAEEAEGPSELQEPPPPPSSGVKEKPEGEEGSAAAPPQPAAIDADTPPAAPAADSSGDVAAVEEEQRESGDGSGRPEPLDMGQADPTPLQRDGHGYDDDDNLYISPAALSPSNSFASYAPSVRLPEPGPLPPCLLILLSSPPRPCCVRTRAAPAAAWVSASMRPPHRCRWAVHRFTWSRSQQAWPRSIRRRPSPRSAWPATLPRPRPAPATARTASRTPSASRQPSQRLPSSSR